MCYESEFNIWEDMFWFNKNIFAVFKRSKKRKIKSDILNYIYFEFIKKLLASLSFDNITKKNYMVGYNFLMHNCPPSFSLLLLHYPNRKMYDIAYFATHPAVAAALYIMLLHAVRPHYARTGACTQHIYSCTLARCVCVCRVHAVWTRLANAERKRTRFGGMSNIALVSTSPLDAAPPPFCRLPPPEEFVWHRGKARPQLASTYAMFSRVLCVLWVFLSKLAGVIGYISHVYT